MKLFKKAVKPTSVLLAIVFLLVSTSFQSASAAMIGTEKLLPAQNPQDQRDRLHQLIAREEIKAAVIAKRTPATPETKESSGTTGTRPRVVAAKAPLKKKRA